MHFGYLNLQNIHCIVYCVKLRVRQLNSKGGNKWKSHFDTNTCDLSVSWFYSKLPVLIDMELIFN